VHLLHVHPDVNGPAVLGRTEITMEDRFGAIVDHSEKNEIKFLVTNTHDTEGFSERLRESFQGTVDLSRESMDLYRVAKHKSGFSSYRESRIRTSKDSF
jgi:hypothetical protein